MYPDRTVPEANIVLNHSTFEVSPTASESQSASNGYPSPQIFVDEMVIALRVFPPRALLIDTRLDPCVFRPVYAALGPPGVGPLSPGLLDLVQ